jgi:hypothetical protein
MKNSRQPSVRVLTAQRKLSTMIDRGRATHVCASVQQCCCLAPVASKTLYVNLPNPLWKGLSEYALIDHVFWLISIQSSRLHATGIYLASSDNQLEVPLSVIPSPSMERPTDLYVFFTHAKMFVWHKRWDVFLPTHMMCTCTCTPTINFFLKKTANSCLWLHRESTNFVTKAPKFIYIPEQ